MGGALKRCKVEAVSAHIGRCTGAGRGRCALLGGDFRHGGRGNAGIFLLFADYRRGNRAAGAQHHRKTEPPEDSRGAHNHGGYAGRGAGGIFHLGGGHRRIQPLMDKRGDAPPRLRIMNVF